MAGLWNFPLLLVCSRLACIVCSGSNECSGAFCDHDKSPLMLQQRIGDDVAALQKVGTMHESLENTNWWWDRRRRVPRRRRAPAGNGCDGSVDHFESIGDTYDKCSGHFSIWTMQGWQTPPSRKPVLVGGRRRRQAWRCDHYDEKSDCGHGMCMQIHTQDRRRFKIECGLCWCHPPADSFDGNANYNINGIRGVVDGKVLKSLEFKMLPMVGAHNANAHPPLWGSLMAHGLNGVKENQDSDMREQVAGGVRYFDVDECIGEDGHSYSCHGTNSLYAKGNKLWGDIRALFEHLLTHRNDIIHWRYSQCMLLSSGGGCADDPTLTHTARALAFADAGIKDCDQVTGGVSPEPCYLLIDYNKNQNTYEERLDTLISHNRRFIVAGFYVPNYAPPHRRNTVYTPFSESWLLTMQPYWSFKETCSSIGATSDDVVIQETSLPRRRRGNSDYNYYAPMMILYGCAYCNNRDQAKALNPFIGEKLYELIKRCHDADVAVGGVTFDYVTTYNLKEIKEGINQAAENAVSLWGDPV